MNCKNCNAVMKPDINRKLFVCPYCESTEPFDSVSKDELQGMLKDAIRDVRKESFKEAKKQLEQEKTVQRTPAQKALDVLILVLQVMFCVFLGICCVAIFTEYVAVGVISLLQLGLMITAMVMKSKYYKTRDEKCRKIKIGCYIAVAVLVIAWIACVMNGGDSPRVGGEEKTWPTQGLGATIPEPNAKLSYSPSSDSFYFNAGLKNFKKQDFDAYVEACKEAGYTEEPKESDDEYVAYHVDTGDVLTISYYDWSDTGSVRIDRAPTFGDLWPEANRFAKMIPKPEADDYSIKSLSDYGLEIYVRVESKIEFVNYITTCQNEGFEGNFDGKTNYFYGTKDSLRVRVELVRDGIMYINVYQY